MKKIEGDKEKIKMLAALVEFLESEPNLVDVKKDREKVFGLFRVVETALNCDLSEDFEPDAVDRRNYNNEEEWREALKEERFEESLKNLIALRETINKLFWQPFKKVMGDFRKEMKTYNKAQAEALKQARMKSEPKNQITDLLPLLATGWKVNPLDKIYSLPLRYEKLEAQLKIDHRINFIHGDRFGLFGAIFNFRDMIDGLPQEIFQQCKYKPCGRWFVVTSKHCQEFCCRKCGSSYSQAQRKIKDPVGYKKYHRKYYMEKRSQGARVRLERQSAGKEDKEE